MSAQRDRVRVGAAAGAERERSGSGAGAGPQRERSGKREAENGNEGADGQADGRAIYWRRLREG